MMTALARNWEEILATLGPIFCERAARYDSTDAFVAENYADMRAAKLFSALVPKELGGGGISYSTACSLIRGFGRCCGSTALAYSMHQHVIATALCNHRHGQTGEILLRKVADGEKILVTHASNCLTRITFGCFWELSRRAKKDAELVGSFVRTKMLNAPDPKSCPSTTPTFSEFPEFRFKRMRRSISAIELVANCKTN